MKTLKPIEEKLIKIHEKMQSWNVLAQNLENIPMDLGVAIMSGRPELITSIARPRACNAEETKTLYKIIACLLEINQALQEHASSIAELSEQLRGSCHNFISSMDKLRDFAQFRDPVEGDDDVSEVL